MLKHSMGSRKNMHYNLGRLEAVCAAFDHTLVPAIDLNANLTYEVNEDSASPPTVCGLPHRPVSMPHREGAVNRGHPLRYGQLRTFGGGYAQTKN